MYIRSQLLTAIIVLVTTWCCMRRGCQAQLVSGCYGKSTSNCSDDQQTISGDLTASDCCLGDGYFYKTSDGNCHQCIVYGWFADTFRAVERGFPHFVDIGYSKAPQNTELRFQYTVLSGSVAIEWLTGHSVINPSNVVLSEMFASASSNVTVFLRLFLDGISQEQPESFTIQLSLVDGVSPPEGSFFRNEIEITIIDSDIVGVSFSADSFSASEGDMELQIRVLKTGARLANPITLTLTPMNVTQAQTGGISIPNLPDDNTFQPNRATSFPESRRDFSMESVDVTFEADARERAEKTVSIVITDDEINEATQYFIIELSVKEVIDTSTVSLVTRNTTLGVIHDNDLIRIGLEFPSYTFLEEKFDHEVEEVFVAKENNVITEQTFLIVVEARTETPNNSIGPAIHDQDYSLNVGGQQTIILQVTPQEQKVLVPFVVFSDTEIERVESFRFTTSSARRNGYPIFSSPLVLHQSAFIFILDNDDAVVGFEQNYTVMESTGMQEICVNVSQPDSTKTLPFEIPILIVISNSEQDGFEFPLEGVKLTLSNMIRRSCFNVSITDDKALTPDVSTSFQLQLDGHTPPNIDLDPRVTEVRVVDDDDVGLRHKQTLLQNNSVLQINEVGNDTDSRIGCFSRRRRPITGWFFPDGTAVTQSSCQDCFYSEDLGGTVVLYQTGNVMTILGTFRCEFVDEEGAVQNVYVNIVPFIEVEVTPKSTNSIARIGQRYTLVCSVSGDELLFRPTLVYRWFKNQDISVGTNSDTLTFNSIQFSDANDYRCEVTVDSIRLTEEVQRSSEAYTLSVTSFLFEVRLSGIADCVQWRGVNTADKLQGILNTLTQGVDQQCRCGFSTDQLSDEALYCFTGSPHSVTLRGILTQSTQNSAMELLNQLQNWTLSTSGITLSGIRLEIDNSCPVLIFSEEDPECLNKTSSAPPSMSDNTALIGGIAGGVVVIVLVVLVLVLILIVIVVMKKWKQKKRSLTKPQTYIEMHPVKIAGHSLVNDEIEDIYDEIDDTYTKVGPSVDRPDTLTSTSTIQGTDSKPFESQRPSNNRDLGGFNYTGCPAYMRSRPLFTGDLQQRGGKMENEKSSAVVDDGLYEN